MSIVLTEDRGAVRHVVLNRPEKRNAFNDELVLGLRDALIAAADDESVHCVVVRSFWMEPTESKTSWSRYGSAPKSTFKFFSSTRSMVATASFSRVPTPVQRLTAWPRREAGSAIWSFPHLSLLLHARDEYGMAWIKAFRARQAAEVSA